MRHFAHHIGDYAAATAHLTFIEDAAYHRLLRLYYQNEKPLPANENEVMRLVRAASRSEKNAVSRILREFFSLEQDGWHQSRADKEVNVYKGQANRGRTNGIFGGRPSRYRNGTATMNHEPITNVVPPEPWEQRIKAWKKSGRWNLNHGPAPGESGCVVPAKYLGDA